VNPKEQLETYKERLLDRYDIEELCDVLDITPTELLNKFEENVQSYADEEGWSKTNEDGPEDSEECNETYP
jgi:hypothetical protein